MRQRSPSFDSNWFIRWGALLGAAIALLFPTAARAGEGGDEPEIVTVSLSGPSPPIAEEAKVRLTAELRTYGFAVRDCEILPEGARACDFSAGAGAVDLTHESHFIAVHAYSGSETPLSQRVSLDRYQTSAELIAIRAVEMLRAAMLQALRSGEREAAPGSVTARFTGWAEQAPAQEPQPAPVLVEPSVKVVSPSPPVHRDAWVFQLGPLLQGTGGGLDLSGGAMGRVRLATKYFFIGLGVEGTPLAAQLSAPSGLIVTRSFGVLSHLGWVAPCGPMWSCHLGVAAGLEQFFFTSRPSENAVGSNARHETLLAAGDVTVTRYLSEGWGIFVGGKAGGLFDAPRIEDQSALGRPLWTLSLGLSARLMAQAE